jgi:hypothetical protein
MLLYLNACSDHSMRIVHRTAVAAGVCGLRRACKPFCVVVLEVSLAALLVMAYCSNVDLHRNLTPQYHVCLPLLAL